MDVKDMQLATAEDFKDPDAEKRAKIPTVGAVTDVYGAYEENLEWVDVKTDSEDKVLEGIKTDGTKYIGGDLEVGGTIHSAGLDAEIADLDAKKVDKVTGKSLIDSEFASSQSSITNPEYLQVTTDLEDKILEGIKQEGTKVIELPLEIQGVRQETIDNPEWISALTDKDGRIFEGRKHNGNKVEFCDVEYPNGIPNQIKTYVDGFIERRKRIIHVIGYGQSLMAGSFSGEPVSTVSKYNNLFKFKGGVRTYDAFGLSSTRASHITRNGEPEYGEMFINPQEKLSAYDYGVLVDSMSTLVPLTEKKPKYKINSDPSIGSDYIQDDNGTYYNIHQNGETVLTSFCNAYNDYYSKGNKDYLFDYIILASCAAYGSAGYPNLLPLDRGGTVPSGEDVANFNYFEVLMTQVVNGKKYADANNLDYSVDYILYFEESSGINQNTNVNVVACRVLQLFSIINTRVKSVTGQRNDIKFIVPSSSLATTTLDLAISKIVRGEGDLELNASEKAEIAAMVNNDIKPYSMSNVYAGHSSYAYAFSNDGMHHSADGQMKIGTTIGLNIAAENYKKPLYPNNIEVVGNDILITYDVPVEPIVIDENAIGGTQTSQEAIERGDKYGYLIKDGVGNIQDIITNV